jgi:hypothetical protein
MWGRLVQVDFKPPTPPSNAALERPAIELRPRPPLTRARAERPSEGFETTGVSFSSFIRICFSTLPLDQMLSQTAPTPTKPGAVIIIIICPLNYDTVAKGCAEAVISGCVMPGTRGADVCIDQAHAPSNDNLVGLYLPSPRLPWPSTIAREYCKTNIEKGRSRLYANRPITAPWLVNNLNGVTLLFGHEACLACFASHFTRRHTPRAHRFSKSCV